MQVAEIVNFRVFTGNYWNKDTNITVADSKTKLQSESSDDKL